MRASVGLSGYTSLLRRCSEHGSAANPPSTSGGHAHGLPQDPSNTPRVAPLPSKWPYRLGTIATIALASPEVICWASVAARGFLPLGDPRAQQNIQRGLHTALLLIVAFLLVPYRGVSSCLLVGVGPIKHDGPMICCWHSGSTCPVMFTEAYTWSCQRILACYRFSHLGTVADRQCAISPCRRFKIGSSFSLANHTHVCHLVGHCCCHA